MKSTLHIKWAMHSMLKKRERAINMNYTSILIEYRSSRDRLGGLVGAEHLIQSIQVKALIYSYTYSSCELSHF